MAEQIQWESEMDKALSRAQAENKPVLLDFFNPGWIGCKQLGAVTYPDAKVISFVNENIIPLQVMFNAQPWAADYNIKWTPTLITLDAEGQEHHRTVGFLPPQELIPSLLLGVAKTNFGHDRVEEALKQLDKLVAEYPQSKAALEAIYLRGVCRYKSTKSAQHLKEAYEQLKAEYPQSEWTMRAEPYQLIKAA